MKSCLSAVNPCGSEPGYWGKSARNTRGMLRTARKLHIRNQRFKKRGHVLGIHLAVPIHFHLHSPQKTQGSLAHLAGIEQQGPQIVIGFREIRLRDQGSAIMLDAKFGPSRGPEQVSRVMMCAGMIGVGQQRLAKVLFRLPDLSQFHKRYPQVCSAGGKFRISRKSAAMVDGGFGAATCVVSQERLSTESILPLGWKRSTQSPTGRLNAQPVGKTPVKRKAAIS